MPRAPEGGLTPKERRFVEEYLVDLNATAAAERAGYSPRVRKAIGSELTHKPRIAAAIKAALDARAERTEVTADAVLSMLWENAALARGNKDYTASNAALVKCGEHVGMWKKGAAVLLNVDLTQLTDAQLQHIASGGDLSELGDLRAS